MEHVSSFLATRHINFYLNTRNKHTVITYVYKYLMTDDYNAKANALAYIVYHRCEKLSKVKQKTKKTSFSHL